MSLGVRYSRAIQNISLGSKQTSNCPESLLGVVENPVAVSPHMVNLVAELVVTIAELGVEHGVCHGKPFKDQSEEIQFNRSRCMKDVTDLNQLHSLINT